MISSNGILDLLVLLSWSVIDYLCHYVWIHSLSMWFLLFFSPSFKVCLLYIENILNVFHAQLNTLLIRRWTFWYEAMVRGGCSCGHCQFCSKIAQFLNFKKDNCAIRLIFLQWSICDYSLKYFLLSNLSNSFEAGGYILVAYWIVFHPDVCRGWVTRLLPQFPLTFDAFWSIKVSRTSKSFN